MVGVLTDIPVEPVYRAPTPTIKAPATKKTGGSGKKGGGGSKASSAQSKASSRYLQQAAALEGQIRAIKNSLGSGFRTSLNQRLANIGLAQTQGVAALKAGYAARVGSLDEAEESNTKAAAASSQENLVNRNRERTQLLSEAMSQGAGESDVLRSQQVALNNWSQNQAEVQRSFHDTITSINAGLTDLNVDTRTAMGNVFSAAEGDKDSAWTNYYNQQSEALVQLGNLRGQQAEYYGMANEQVGSKGALKSRSGALASSDGYFMQASRENAKAFKSAGEPKWLQSWKGQEAYESDIPLRSFEQSQPKLKRLAAPQGATLRKWE